MSMVPAEIIERMVNIRRDLHEHPELSGQELRTATQIAAALVQLGIPFQQGVAGTGLVAELPGPTEHGVVALRADMDALPIVEETGLPFASRNHGVMHACGHDGHVAMLLGAAEMLAALPQRPAAIRFIFQPAEEVGSGAKQMVAEGVLKGVRLIFGAHLDRHYPTGTVAISDGVVNASTDMFRIAITGQGGHAARPHEGIDAVVVGSLLITALQTIVSREMNPAFPSVVTVGRFMAGTAANVIAGTAVLEGTIRAQHPHVRQHLKRSLRRIAESVGQLHAAGVEVSFADGTPAVINTPWCAEVARAAARTALGPEHVVPLHTANMGGEDFAYFLEQVPGCYLRVGAQATGREGFPAHSSKFDFDEAALAVGAAWFRAVALEAGRRLPELPPA
ncbi:MAG TPA: M20 family metallopeptidase [Gemmatales bacterium]|nr:M20 family metallopeptidase [Gemmatales bacterium]HMP58003.1 M20 family metallopeptidase [Gemmatales bacterium]